MTFRRARPQSPSTSTPSTGNATRSTTSPARWDVGPVVADGIRAVTIKSTSYEDAIWEQAIRHVLDALAVWGPVFEDPAGREGSRRSTCLGVGARPTTRSRNSAASPDRKSGN